MSTPSQETNGAVATESSEVAAVTQTVTPSGKQPKGSKHQIDGSYIPLTGPITNIRQLTRGRNVAKGAIESFETVAAYTEFLRSMTLAELHRHAVEEARVVPIDDSERLIRRLENNWTEVAARERGRLGKGLPVQGQRFSDEQLAKQAALRKRMLGARG